MAPTPPLIGACLFEVLNDLLEPRGYVRRGGMWRKDGRQAVLTFRLWEDLRDYEFGVAVWFKTEGQIDPKEVKPDGKFHIAYDFKHESSDELITRRQRFRLIRALNFGLDYAEHVPRTYDQEFAAEILNYYAPQGPLTEQWRREALNEALEQHILPWIDRIDSGDSSALNAKLAKMEEEEDEERERWHSLISAGVARLRKSEREEDKVLLAIVRDLVAQMTGMGSKSECAIVFSIATGRTLDDVKRLISDCGLWARPWSSLDEFEVDDAIENQPFLSLTSDGKVEFSG